MRGLKLTALSLTMVLALCAPALGTPTYSQYGVETGEFCPAASANSNGNTAQAQSLRDGACAAADNVGQGTDAVNDALDEGTSSASASAGASASGGTPFSAAGTSVPGEASAAPSEVVSAGDNVPQGVLSKGHASGDAGGAAASGDNAGGSTEGGLASITELPETGGPPPTALSLGVLLATLGLIAWRIVR